MFTYIWPIKRGNALWGRPFLEDPNTLQSTCSFSDTLDIPLFLSANLVSTVTLADSLSSVGVSAVLSDSLTFVDTISGKLTISETLSDSLSLVDLLQVYFDTQLTESVSLTDVLTGLTEIDGSLTDVLVATDILSGVLRITSVLTSSGTLLDSISGDIVASGIVSPQANVIFVINAETGAVSTYTFTTTVSGSATYNNTLFLSCNDGLYALDNSTDNGTDISWEARTGFSNFGSDLIKRVIDVSVLARCSGVIEALTVSARYGEKVENRYSITRSTAGAFRDQIIKTGRGASGIYWQIGIAGKGPGEVNEMRVAAEPLSRRK